MPRGRALAAAALLAALWPAAAPALGLAGADSRPGLRALPTPLRFTVNADALSASLLGPQAVPAELGAQAYARLEKAGLTLKDGEFDPRREAFVSLDVWVRGASKPDSPKDPRRVFHLELQVFAPAALLKGGAKSAGRVLVWERSLYGACKAGELKEQLAVFLGLCEELGSDYAAAKGR